MRVTKTVELIGGVKVLVLDDFLCAQMGIGEGSVVTLGLDGKTLNIVPLENRIEDAVFEKVFRKGIDDMESVLEALI